MFGFEIEWKSFVAGFVVGIVVYLLYKKYL